MVLSLFVMSAKLVQFPEIIIKKYQIFFRGALWVTPLVSYTLKVKVGGIMSD